MDLNRWEKRKTLLALLLVIVGLIGTRGLALNRYATADENAWLTRSANFYRALYQGNWAGTFQRHHPGVMVTWAGTAGFATIYPDYASKAPREFGWLTEEIVPFLRQAGYAPATLLAAGRAYIVLMIVLTLVLSWWMANRLFGRQATLVGFLLLAFDPFHVGLSRLMHLDGLLSCFMLLTLLAYLNWLNGVQALHSLTNNDQGSDIQRPGKLLTHRGWFLLTSAISAGLAWLTRSNGLFLLPFIGIITGLYLLATHHSMQRNHSDIEPRSWTLERLFSKRILKMYALGITLWGGTAAATFVLLWPAMWVDPWGNLSKVIGAATNYASEGHGNPIFFQGVVYSGDPGNLFYPITYLWRTTPSTFLGLGLALLALLLKSGPLSLVERRRAIWSLLLFALLFGLLMNMGSKKFDRYLLPVYPPLDLIAGMGWVCAGYWFRSLGKRLFQAEIRYIAPILVGSVILLQASLTLYHSPYYLSYYNPLLGGGHGAEAVMMIGRGEGADQAARYLNQKLGTHAKQTTVASAYVNGPFSYFFQGRTLPITFWHEAEYAVLYTQDWQRRLPSPRQIAYFEQRTPEHRLYVNDIEYARIYAMQDAPLPKYVVDWRVPNSDSDQPPQIRLVSYEFPASTIAPGQSLRSTLYLLNLAEIETDLNVLARLVGADGDELVRSEGWPWGSPTSTWKIGDVWPDGHGFQIPTDASPGFYRLELTFYDPETLTRLQAIRPLTGELLGESATIDYLYINEAPPSPQHPFKSAMELGDQIELLGWALQGDSGQTITLTDTESERGQTLHLRLFWQTRSPLPIDYTAFVHMVGSNGAMVTQQDQQPLNGFMPTTVWRTDQIIVDEYTLAIPVDAPADSASIFVGMYDHATGQRLPIYRRNEADEKELVGDAFLLGSIAITNR